MAESIESLDERYKKHVLNCEILLESIDNSSRLDDDQLKAFHSALDENKDLLVKLARQDTVMTKQDINMIKQDSESQLYSDQLHFYNEVIIDILNNQVKLPRPPGP